MILSTREIEQRLVLRCDCKAYHLCPTIYFGSWCDEKIKAAIDNWMREHEGHNYEIFEYPDRLEGGKK